MLQWSSIKRSPLYLDEYIRNRSQAGLLQVIDGMNCQKTAPYNRVLRPIACASMSLSTGKTDYSNEEGEELDILHGLQKFHNYCFTGEVHLVKDHKTTSINI